MLNCPFCGIDLTNRTLNGQRCPSCAARLVWDDEVSDSAGAAQEDSPGPSATQDSKSASGPSGATEVDSKQDKAVPTGPLGSIHETMDVPNGAVGQDKSPDASATDAAPHGEHMRTIDPRTLTSEQAVQLETLWHAAIPEQSPSTITLKPDSTKTVFARELTIPPRGLEHQDASLDAADYKLLDRIGEGGVGIVHSARQVSVNRTVAVKMLKPAIAEDLDHRDKFLVEAVVTADLDHPNIVPIYELGQDQSNALFYSMKRVQGTPWSDEIRTKATAENLDIIMKVTDAIAFAHSRGVIHRDLKPENVMLGEFGEVLVMDWGIALSTSAFLKSDSITQSTSMGGTPAYMAPEMATGPITAIGVGSDVYLLGAILFEIITGQPPHTGTDVMDCLRAAARNDIVPTSKSGELLDIAYRALSTPSEERFASVQEFQKAIRQYQAHSESIVLSQRAAETLLEARETEDYHDFSRALFAYQEAIAIWQENKPAQMGLKEVKFAYAAAAHKKEDYDLALSLLDANEPEQAQLVGQIEQARDERTARQQRLKAARRMVLALAALVFVVVTGALFAVIRSSRETTNSLLAEMKAKEDTEIALKTAEVLRITAEKAEGAANVAKESAEKAEAEALEAKDSAEKARTQAEEASYLAQIGLAAERIDSNAFLDASELLQDYGPDTSDDRTQNWEWGHLDYLCHLADATLETDNSVESVTVSVDGRWLVAGTSDGTVRVWDFPADKKPESFSHTTDPVLAVAISPDGQFVLSGGAATGAIQVWKRSQHDQVFQHQRELPSHESAVYSLRFSSDGTRLLSTSEDKTAKLWSWPELAELQAFRGHSGPVHAAAIHPDGSLVVTASEDGTVRVWPVSLSDEPTKTQGKTRQTLGEQLQEVRKRIRFEAHEGAVYAVDFVDFVVNSPDKVPGIALAGRNGNILVWDLNKAVAALTDPSTPEEVKSEEEVKLEEVILTRDGNQVRLFDIEKVKSALEAKAGAANVEHIVVDVGLRVLPGHSAEVRSLSFANSFQGHQGNFLVSGGHDNTVKVWNLDLDQRQESTDWPKTFRGHGGWVRSAIFLPMDSLIASGGYDKQVKIWNPQKYEEVRVLKIPKKEQRSAIADASLSVDGLRAITAGRDGLAYVWNVDSGKHLYELRDTGEAVGENPTGTSVTELTEGHEFLVSNSIFFPPSDHRLLTSAGDSTVRLWNYDKGGQLRTFEPTGPNAAMALSKDGRWLLLTSGQGDDAYLWDVEDGQRPRAILSGHRYEVTALDISSEGDLEQRMIFTGDAGGHCKLWQWNSSAEAWQSVRELVGHERRHQITAASFLPGNRFLLTASQDYTVMRWEVPSGKLLIDLTLKHPGGVRAMAISDDGQHAVTVCQDSVATCENTDNAAEPTDKAVSNWRLSHWDLADSRLLHSHCVAAKMITSLALSRDGQSALVVAAPDSVGQVYRWQFVPDRYEPLWGKNIHLGAVWAASVSPDTGSVVIVGGSKAEMRREQDGQLEQSFSPHRSLNSAAFSPSGALAATAGSDGVVKIWELEKAGQVIWKIPAAHGNGARSVQGVNSVVFGPRVEDGDEYLLTAGDDGTARLWQLGKSPSKDPFATLHGHNGPIRQAVFSPDGTRIATVSSEGGTQVWDVTDPLNVTRISSMEAKGSSVCFSPDRTKLVIGHDDNIATIWNLQDETQPVQLESLKGHTASLTSVAFSPDGTRVVSGSKDGVAKVWDATSGKQLLSLDRHRAEVTSVAFSADGHHILTASSDETAIVWMAPPLQADNLKADLSTIGAP